MRSIIFYFLFSYHQDIENFILRFTVFETIKYYRLFVDIACCNLLSRRLNVLMKNNLSRKKALGAYQVDMVR